MATGFEGLGSTFLAEVGGVVMTCKKRGTGKKGKLVCNRFRGGPGAPRGYRGRKAARFMKTARARYRGAKHRSHPTSRLPKSLRGMSRGSKRHCTARYKSGKKSGRCKRFAKGRK